MDVFNGLIKKIILPVLAVALLFGCGGRSEEPHEEIGVETADRAEDISLFELFPSEKGNTTYYEGDSEYLSVETLVNVENLFRDGRESILYIEGMETVRDAIGERRAPYLKKIRITEEKVELIRGDVASILIQGPLESGKTWETEWFTGKTGFFKATVSIDSVYENALAITVVPAEPQEDNVADDFSQEIYMEKGKGIASEESGFSYADGREFAFKRWIYKTSQIPEMDFVSRYVSPPELLRPLYQRDNCFYEKLVDDELKKIAYGLSGEDDERLASYMEFLSGFGESDLLSIRPAALVAIEYAKLFEDATPLIRAFKNYHEEVIAYNAFDSKMVDISEIRDLYEYSRERGRYVVREPSSIDSAEMGIKASVLIENGIGVAFAEGMPYLSPDSLFLGELFSGIEFEKAKRYMELVAWEQENKPIISDGGIGISWENLSERMFMFESYARDYPRSVTGMWADEKAEEFFELYAVPNQFLPNTPKYRSGIINAEIAENYEAYVDRHPESDYASDLKGALQILDANDGMYSMELDSYLEDKGYKPNIGDFVKKMMEERVLQEKDLDAIYDDYGKISTENPDSSGMDVVEVSNGSEFLDALASDTRVVLKKGAYLIPYEYDAPNAVTRFGETSLNGIENLIIEGEGGKPVNLLSEAYGYVFKLENCRNVTFRNLRMGHLQEYCKAGVLNVRNSEDIRILNSIIFGSGEWGLEAENVRGLFVDKTLIADCASTALRLFDSSRIYVTGTNMVRNGINVVWMENDREVVFSNVRTFQNNKSYYARPEAVFEINGSEEIFIEDSFFSKMNNQELAVGDSVNEVIVK